MKTALVFVALLSGCASMNNGMKAEVLGANIEIAKTKAQAAAKPILDATIPTPNGIMHIVVHAPQGSGSGQVSMPDDGWARVADRAVGVLGTAAGLYLGGEAAVNLVEGASKGIVNALTVQQPPTVVMAPNPIVVAPAEPVIVQQAPPVIVDPVVVNPVIVEQQTYIGP